jgi:phospholipid/cholesterol/gamma-HCH transport system substrate-binding protein
MDIDASLELPVDTAAGIRTSGLLGYQFIALEPGAEDDVLVTGDELQFTESALNLDKLIGAVFHGGLGSDE